MHRTLTLAVLVLSGCFERQYDCDAMAAASVEVTLASSSGELLEEIEVLYTGPGAMEQQACEPMGSSWICGWEVAGEVLVEARALCHGDASATVDVPMGECHVQQQSVHLLLDPVDCTAEEVPSVMVEVVDEQGEPLADPSVGYLPAHADWMDYEPCVEQGEAWACGWGWSGVIAIEVEAEGFAPWSGEVTVDEDCCGPVTVQLRVVMVLQG
jgi:hypothetical protein